MATLPPGSPGTTDVAAQVAVVQGVDSNVFQTGDPPTRHPALFTSLEASLGYRRFGRAVGDSGDLRVFGRAVNYEPIGPDFESRTGRLGFSWLGASRIDPRTTLLTTLLGTVGSLQSARGSDAALGAVDPVSTRRSIWTTSGSSTLVFESTRATTLRVLGGVDVGGTIREFLPDGSTRRGLDFIIVRSRLAATHRWDRFTTLEPALLVERLHSEYVLGGGRPLGAESGSIDGGSATATFGVTRAFSAETSGFAAAGLTLAYPRFHQLPIVFPVGWLGVAHVKETWSFTTLGTVQYGLAQPRLGPGVSATVSAILVGRPFGGSLRDSVDVIAELSAQRTGISIGPNDGASATVGGGSLTARLLLGSGFGLLLGYDLRASRVLGPGTTLDSPWYVRHMGFVGLSYAWGSGTLSAIPTLARPVVAPFTP